MSCETSLNQLSVETRAKLRSSQLLTSLPQVVSELLQNSLDAGASQVDIGVDCEEWSCWVRDNGAGISKAGLTMIGKGSEEGRYSESCFMVLRHATQPVSTDTSKAYTPTSLESVSTFGFRGEGLVLFHTFSKLERSLRLFIALSSMAELCCLEISSRTSRSRESWSVILKVRECVCCANTPQLVLQGGKPLYSGPSIRWRRETAGTVVCVRDAFFSVSQVIYSVSSYDAHT